MTFPYHNVNTIEPNSTATKSSVLKRTASRKKILSINTLLKAFLMLIATLLSASFSVFTQAQTSSLEYCGYTQDNFLSLDFPNATITVESGTANTIGAVYRFAGVATDVDAIATVSTLDASSNANLNSGRLGGNVRNDDDVNDYANFGYNVQLVEAGTSTAISPVDIFLTSYDLDSQLDSTVKEFSEYKNANIIFLGSDSSNLEFVAGTIGERAIVRDSAIEINPNVFNADHAAGAMYFNATGFDVYAGFIDSIQISTSSLLSSGRTIFNVGQDERYRMPNPVCTVLFAAAPEVFPAINGRDGGVTSSVLASDIRNGIAVDPADVTITVGTSDPELSLDSATGFITVDAGTPAGTYTVEYTICENLNSTYCAAVVETVTVSSAPIAAAVETFPAINGRDGGVTSSVLASDSLNGVSVDLADVTLTVGAVDSELSLSSSSGLITVASGTPAGTYTVEYTMCENLNSANCATAVETVVVSAAPIASASETAFTVNGADGGVTSTILASDLLNGAAVEFADVILTVGTLAAELSLDSTTGLITVAPGTQAGSYTVEYTVCEALNPANCETAIETVIVSAAPISPASETFSSINGMNGGATSSVLASDLLNGVAVDSEDVTLSVGASAPELSLASATALITVAPDTPAGTYTVEYTICENLNPTNCASVVETVVVDSAPIATAVEEFPVINGTDGGVTGSVLASDRLNGVAVNLSDITLTIGASDPELSLDTNTGLITVAAVTAADSYTVEYTLCENLNPTNCSTTVETVVVDEATIVTALEAFSAINGTDGGVTGSVLASDLLSGVAVDPADITLTVGTSASELSLDSGTGLITVASGTQAGAYTVEYTICENLNPMNCATAVETVVVEAAPIASASEVLASIDGEGGGVTSSVLASDSFNGVAVDLADITLTVGASDSELSLAPATGLISVASNTSAGTYTVEYTICENLNPTNCATAVETVVVDAPPTPVDPDGDGLTSAQEMTLNTDPMVADTDGDGINDGIELGGDASLDADDTNPLDADSDDDGLSDGVERSGFDGVSNSGDETNPLLADSDNDGVNDGTEVGVTVATALSDGMTSNGVVYAGTDTTSSGFVADEDPATTTDPTNRDSDNDGLSDGEEDANFNGAQDNPVIGGTGTSGSGETDPNSIDSDGDGLTDGDEVNGTGMLMGQGSTDPLDVDTDDGGTNDGTEVIIDITNPAVAGDDVVADSDGDGLNDNEDSAPADACTPFSPSPTCKDTDGDGIADFGTQTTSVPVEDSTAADDNPCEPNSSSRACDTDNDGIPDGVEDANDNGVVDAGETDPNKNDTDNDGIPDAVEAGVGGLPVDFDGDGLPNAVDPDSDNDGIPDALELVAEVNSDTDEDGIPNYLDLDSDNDGIPDALEHSNTVPVLTGVDTDQDGVDDAVDVDQTGGVDANLNGLDDALEPSDFDGDQIADHLDNDSDNDTIPDGLENHLVSNLDTDMDGILDLYDVDQTGGVDANNDGIDDAVRVTDTDGDGSSDYIDIDADNDSIPDRLESVLPTTDVTDTDGDQIIDIYDVDETGGEDIDGNGIDDSATLENTDGDTVPDYLDLDTDNDGLLDISEAAVEGLDANDDGLVDELSTQGSSVTPSDSDSDNNADYREIDSDADGINDNVGTSAAELDADNDGVIDDVADEDGDGVPNVNDPGAGSFGIVRLDSDNDGVMDSLDLDDDNDGIPDILEGAEQRVDTDGDGVIDSLDLDSDNDGLADVIEAAIYAVDNDGNGMIDDFIDTNNDGLHDSVTDAFVPSDVDADTLPDYRDLDSDGDGLNDQSEGVSQFRADANVKLRTTVSGAGGSADWVFLLFCMTVLLARRRC